MKFKFIVITFLLILISFLSLLFIFINKPVYSEEKNIQSPKSIKIFLDDLEIEVNPSVYLKLINSKGEYVEYSKIKSLSSYEIELNEKLLFANFSINISDNSDIRLSPNNEILNCEYDNYKVDLNEHMLANDILINHKSYINIEDYILNSDLSLRAGCQKYSKEIYEIETNFNKLLSFSRATTREIFGLFKHGKSYYWKIKNKSKLIQSLTEIKNKLTVAPYTGAFEEFDDFIAVYELPVDGRSINVENSIHVISNWVNNRGSSLNLPFDKIKKEIYPTGKPVYDFTRRVGTGQTRIDLIRNGQGNLAAHYAELGLEEIQKIIIMPNEEFSYLKHIDKQPGLSVTASGRFIGSGYCNSTTTIFRAALETGLPITDRSPHAVNINSYNWGYPINAVDSTFLAIPGQEIDLKFINNFSYPIMLYFEKAQDQNNYQYHYVHIFTSSKAVKRNVELYDWRKWGIYSPTHFQAEFKRRVSENGRVILNDSFYSRYIDF